MYLFLSFLPVPALRGGELFLTCLGGDVGVDKNIIIVSYQWCCISQCFNDGSFHPSFMVGRLQRHCVKGVISLNSLVEGPG